jgi:hypothetical protein
MRFMKGSSAFSRIPEARPPFWSQRGAQCMLGRASNASPSAVRMLFVAVEVSNTTASSRLQTVLDLAG